MLNVHGIEVESFSSIPTCSKSSKRGGHDDGGACAEEEEEDVS